MFKNSKKARVISYTSTGIILVMLLILFPTDSEAQDNRLIHTQSWQYEYIKQLQQRGYLLDLNPTDLPYAVKDLRQALDKIDSGNLNPKEKRWVERLDQSVRQRPVNVDSMRVGGFIEPGLRRSSSERLNVIDPLGEGKPVLPRARFNGYMEWKNWIGQAGATFDWFYDIDPDGLDTGDRLYMRSEGGYFGYDGNILDLHVGRFDNHWSVYDQPGTFLTDNPQSFDQIQLKFGTSKLSFSSILGELDNMGADSTFTGFDHELGSFRRYFFVHRLDWSPTPQLKLSYIEGETYFSPSSGISLKNLLPLQFLFLESSNRPRNNNINLGVGGSIWYQTGFVTLYLQGMLDDLVVADRAEKLKEDYFIPIVYSITGSMTITDIGNSFDLGVETDLVSANSYRSERYQDQWTYAQRGLATNFSDYIRTKAYATFYPGWLEGLKVEPGMTYYLKGTEDLRDLRTKTEPDGTQIPSILAGTVERTLRPSLYLRYQPMGSFLGDRSNDIRFNFWLDADMGYNITENHNNIQGATNQRFIGLFRLFGQFTF